MPLHRAWILADGCHMVDIPRRQGQILHIREKGIDQYLLCLWIRNSNEMIFSDYKRVLRLRKVLGQMQPTRSYTCQECKFRTHACRKVRHGRLLSRYWLFQRRNEPREQYVHRTTELLFPGSHDGFRSSTVCQRFQVVPRSLPRLSQRLFHSMNFASRFNIWVVIYLMNLRTFSRLFRHSCISNYD